MMLKFARARHSCSLAPFGACGLAFEAKATVAAWKQKPSYAVIPTQDRMINPDLERFMANRAQSQVIKLPGSHAIFLSHARDVAALIEKAATAAK